MPSAQIAKLPTQPIAPVSLAEQIVRCGSCRMLFNRAGMVTEYKDEIWCAWCISRYGDAP